MNSNRKTGFALLTAGFLLIGAAVFGAVQSQIGINFVGSSGGWIPVSSTNPLPVDATLSGEIQANQGDPNTQTNRWPVFLSDGTNAQGTSTNPLIVSGSSTGGSANSPVQGTNLLNSDTIGAANTAVVATLSAVSGERNHVYSVDAVCSAGDSEITITNGGSNIWHSLTGEVTTVPLRLTWPVALTGATNSAVVITLASCGVGNTGTLIVQADRF